MQDFNEKAAILNELLSKATFFIQNTKVLETSVTEALKYLAEELKHPVSPSNVMEIFKQVMNLHNNGLSIINSIVEKFPLEMTIQELQLLQDFRMLSDINKSTVINFTKSIAKVYHE